MRVKIISPGRSINEAKVVNAETGEILKGVVRVEVLLDAQYPKAEAVVWIRDPIIEMEAEIKRRCHTTGEVIT